MPEYESSIVTGELLARVRAGDAAAKNDLLAHVNERLRVLVSIQLRRNVRLHRWEATGDVLQDVLLKLSRAMDKVEIKDERNFYGLASAQIRRVLIDLWRHHFGPEGQGRHHASIEGRRPDESSDGVNKLEQLAGAEPETPDLGEVHVAVEKMPGEMREVVDLVWYQGLSHEEAARVLEVSTKTIQRRWREAKLQLADALAM